MKIMPVIQALVFGCVINCCRPFTPIGRWFRGETLLYISIIFAAIHFSCFGNRLGPDQKTIMETKSSPLEEEN